MYYGYITSVIKSRMIRLAGHMARRGEKYLLGVVVGCIRRILKEMEMEMDGVDQIHLAKDKDKWWDKDSGLPGRYAVKRVI
jgi:hypothetical protein